MKLYCKVCRFQSFTSFEFLFINCKENPFTETFMNEIESQWNILGAKKFSSFLKNQMKYSTSSETKYVDKKKTTQTLHKIQKNSKMKTPNYTLTKVSEW